jgi:hypothetical protein
MTALRARSWGDALELEDVADSQSLSTKLEEALARIDEGNVEAACGALRALIHEARGADGPQAKAGTGRGADRRGRTQWRDSVLIATGSTGLGPASLRGAGRMPLD